jgi:hypothetical protein
VLLAYVRRAPSPLSVVAAVLSALRTTVAARERDRTKSTLELRAALKRFQLLQARPPRSCCAVLRRDGFVQDRQVQGVGEPSAQQRCRRIRH